MRTKFNEAANSHLFAESVFMVLALVQLMHVIGPIIGGLINAEVGMSTTCLSMAYMGMGCLVLYVVFAIFVYCTVHQENNLNLGQADLDLDDEIYDKDIDPVQHIFDMANRAASDAEESGLLSGDARRRIQE